MADSLIRMQFGGSETNLEKLPTQASVGINLSVAEEYANWIVLTNVCFETLNNT